MRVHVVHNTKVSFISIYGHAGQNSLLSCALSAAETLHEYLSELSAGQNIDVEINGRIDDGQNAPHVFNTEKRDYYIRWYDERLWQKQEVDLSRQPQGGIRRSYH